MLQSPDGWIYFPRPNKQAQLRLFCFPGVGTSAAMFFSWPRWLPPWIEIAAMQLPGRTPEPDISPEADHSLMIPEIAEAIGHYQDRPCAFFGYSLGALAAFEVARALGSRDGVTLARLFLACFPPPHLPAHEGFIQASSQSRAGAHSHLAVDALFPRDVPLQDKAPAASHRRDIQIWKDYHYRPMAPFACPLTIFGATEDELIREQSLSSWAVHARGEFHIRMFTGNHTFFYEDPQPLLDAIVRQAMSPVVDW